MHRALLRLTLLAASTLFLAACNSDSSTTPPSVTQPVVAAISVDSASLALYAGLARQITTTTKDSDGNVLTGRAITWTSSDETVATVSSSGIITSVHFGTATITASVDGKSATIAVKVKHDPILFVHGFASSAAIWTTMTNAFVADGWSAADITAWSYDTSLSNVVIAQQVKTKVDSVTVATGAPKVDLISHSMGSLSTRYYTGTLGGASKVDAWVSLGGPNHGTTIANFCGTTSCIEMRPGSSFLTALNSGDETPGSSRYATWRTPCDEATTPPESVSLSGATNNVTACIGHSDLYLDPTVYGQVRDFIK